MEESKQSSSGLEFLLHPLVLINISDHSTRTKANSPANANTKVLGCLLGLQSGRTIDISNSFEIKYETLADGDADIDQAFMLKKQEQYKQVFPKLDVVGWYMTGEDVQESDMLINKKLMAVNESPVLLVMDTQVKPMQDLPVTLYETELHVIDGVPQQIFVKATYTVETSDAERIGVDQVAKILPSGKASGSEQLTAHLMGTHSAITMLNNRITDIIKMLKQMQAGTIPFNHALVRKVASLIHSLPAHSDMPAFEKDFLTEYNDALLAVYLAYMTKGVNSSNDIVDKVMQAYGDKTPRRRGGMGAII